MTKKAKSESWEGVNLRDFEQKSERKMIENTGKEVFLKN